MELLKIIGYITISSTLIGVAVGSCIYGILTLIG